MCDDKASKHHHVPKTYLKPWAFESNNRSVRVDTYSPSGAYLGHAVTKYILNREDLYTIYRIDGSRDLKWECWFNRCETEYTKARDRVIKNQHVFDNDLKLIILFMAAQRNRASATIDKHSRNTEIFNDLDKLHGFTPRLLASNHLIMAEEKAASTVNIITDIVMPEIHRMVSLMAGMYSSIVLTKEDAGFWTCDNPVIMTDGPQSFNMLSPDIKIVLPIDPMTCVRLSRKRMGRSLFSGPELDSFNSAVEKQASELVIHKRVGAVQPTRFNGRPARQR